MLYWGAGTLFFFMPTQFVLQGGENFEKTCS